MVKDEAFNVYIIVTAASLWQSVSFCSPSHCRCKCCVIFHKVILKALIGSLIFNSTVCSFISFSLLLHHLMCYHTWDLCLITSHPFCALIQLIKLATCNKQISKEINRVEKILPRSISVLVFFLISFLQSTEISVQWIARRTYWLCNRKNCIIHGRNHF